MEMISRWARQKTKSGRTFPGLILDTFAPVLFLPPVHLMPTIKVMSAQRGQGHSSCWRAARAFGIVRNKD